MLHTTRLEESLWDTVFIIQPGFRQNFKKIGQNLSKNDVNVTIINLMIGFRQILKDDSHCEH